MITITDQYGPYDFDVDSVSYLSWHENNVGIRTGSRLWKLSFETTEEARQAITSIVECLEFHPLVIKASMWTHYIDMEDITAVGPILACPNKGSLYHLVVDTLAGEILIKDGQSNLTYIRSMILDNL